MFWLSWIVDKIKYIVDKKKKNKVLVNKVLLKIWN